MRIAMGVTGSGVVISAVQSVARSFGGFGNIFGGMGNALSNLRFGLNNLSTEGTIGMDALRQSAVGFGQGFLALGAIAGVAIGAIAVGIGVVAVKAAGDFQAGMTTLQTGAGELAKNMGLVSRGILNMSVTTATSTKQLTNGMFQIESAGYRGADGLNVLQSAAEGAKVGNADLGVTANAVTTVMKDYNISAKHAGDAMNFLTAIVQNGKTTLQDLAGSMSTVLPVASSVGVKLIDVGGAMATMTGEGVPAANAATYLRQMIMSLAAPASAGAKSLLAIGLTSQQVSSDMKKSLPDTLKMIMAHLAETYKVGSPEYVTALKNIAGGSKQMQGMLDLTGTHLKDFQSNVTSVSGTMNTGKGSIVGWNAVQQDFNFKVAQAKQAINVFLIQLGTQLMPIFSKLMALLLPIIMGFLNWVVNSGILKAVLQTLVNAITTMVSVGTNLVNFFKNNEVAMAALKATLILVAIVVGTVMVIALIAYTIAAWNAAAANIAAFWPVYLVILIIVIIITVVILAVQHWGQIAHWLQGIWAAIAGFFVMLWNGILTGLRAVGAFFVMVWTAIVAFLTGVWNGVAGVARTVWGAISGFFMGIWNAVSGFFAAAWHVILAVLTVAWNVIKTVALVIFALIVFIIILPFVPLINWFKAHWTQIHAVLVASWNMIKSTAMTVWNAIVGFFTTIWNAVRTAFTTAWNAVSSFLSAAWNTIKSVGTTVWNAISSFFMAVWTPVAAFMQAVWNAISSALSVVWNAVASVASTVWNGISTSIMNVVNTLKGLLGTAWNDVKSGFSNAMNALAGIARGAWNNVSGAIKSAIDGMIGLINNMINGVNSVTSKVGVPAIPDIPLLARGGSNLAAGPYIVGDAGPEMLYLPGGSSVVPMSGGRTGSTAAGAVGAGPTYNITINLSTLARTQADVRNLVDLIDQEMSRRVRAQTPEYSTGVF